MKKKLTLLIAGVLACLLFVMAGCNNQASNASLEGTTWTLTGGTQDGLTFTQEQIESILGEITYTFEKDGVVIAKMGDMSMEGSWHQDGNQVTITSEGETGGTFTINGDKMTMEHDEGTIEFSKKS